MNFLRDMFWVYRWVTMKIAIVVPVMLVVYALVVAVGDFLHWAYGDPETAMRESFRVGVFILTISGVIFWVLKGLCWLINEANNNEGQPW